LLIITKTQEEEMNTYKKPAIAIHPGEILKDELDAREWTQKEFARIIGRPEKTISAIIQGKKDITPETALEIAAALGTSPDLWNDMQAKYNLHTATQKAEEQELIERRARLYGLVPIDELLGRGYLVTSEKIEDLEAKVCELLGIRSINENFSLEASFRLAKHTTADYPSIIAWLKIIEQKSRETEAPRYLAEALKIALPEITALSKSVGGCAEVAKKLQKTGVKLVFEPPFKGTHIDGAVIYVKGAPVIGMTIRLDRIDNFWFTLIHELGHIILNHKTGFVDINVTDKTDAPDEIKANEWAAGKLLSNDEYNKFVIRTKPYFARRTIIEFADKVGVHPGIVLGRLQRDRLIPWKNLRDLLEKVSPFVNR
jgi:HTH-type transcriptional regulator/antitoxin HigA